MSGCRSFFQCVSVLSDRSTGGVSFLSKSKGYKVGTELRAKEKERPDKYDYKDLKSFIYYIQIGAPVVDIPPKKTGQTSQTAVSPEMALGPGHLPSGSKPDQILMPFYHPFCRV